MDLCNYNDLKALLGRHGFRFSKSMGQNFLIADWVPRGLAEAVGADETACVLEIGPGVGPVTAELAKRAGRVVAVELDRDLLPVLAETMADRENVTVVSGDVLRLDLPTLIAEHFGGLRPLVCSNLPYNITTPVITLLLESGSFGTIALMLQKEAAARICALPGQKDYGAFSVFCRYYAHCEMLFEVPAECFLPAPNVTSAVLRLVPRSAPPPEVEDADWFFRTVRAAFAQRRKTLLNCLSAAFGSRLSRERLRELLERCAIDPRARGETLGIPEYARLAAALSHAWNS